MIAEFYLTYRGDPNRFYKSGSEWFYRIYLVLINIDNFHIDPFHPWTGSLQALSLYARVDQGIMAVKEYSTPQRVPEQDHNELNKATRCPWCNGYRRRKWTRRHEFKSWTRLIAFHIALIPLGKVWIQLFSLQLWVNSRTD